MPVYTEGAVVKVTQAEYDSAAFHYFVTPYEYHSDEPVQLTWVAQVQTGSYTYEYYKHTAYLTYPQNLTLSTGIDEVRADFDLDLGSANFANIENGTLLGSTAHHLVGSAGTAGLPAIVRAVSLRAWAGTTPMF